MTGNVLKKNIDNTYLAVANTDLDERVTFKVLNWDLQAEKAHEGHALFLLQERLQSWGEWNK